jgi:hypothetical protein
MIISQIFGGLGNQMFQYAAGRALSLGRNQPLLLDVSRFAGYGLHQGFELDRVFLCPTTIATETEMRDILGWQFSPYIRRGLAHRYLTTFRRDAFVFEPHFQYWSAINQVPQKCYLAGYWQSERYFQSQEATIRADFTFKSPLVNDNAVLAEQISQVNAVSIHVRRGDYVLNPKTEASHGLCSLDYYRAAVQLIAERVHQPHFYIFSDDMAWVKDNLKIDFPHWYVDYNHGLDSYIDMHLMSLCQHHIIANSSFSWWGAWLNPNANKIVLAPKKWFAHPTDVSDLFPYGWIAL